MNEDYERDKILEKNPGAVKQLNAILKKHSKVRSSSDEQPAPGSMPAVKIDAAAYTMAEPSTTPHPAPGTTPEDAPKEPPDLQIAQDLFDVIKEYIVIPDNELYILTVFALHTHSAKTGSFTPYLDVCSAEKGSGKTRVLKVLTPLVCNPLFTENISAAALARMVEQEDGTMLIDEIDTVLGRMANKETAETMRGILNSGYHQSGAYVRMVGVGTNMQPHKFSTFCPKVLSGLGHLPDTVASRSIMIRLRRAHRNECKRFRPDGNCKSAKQLREKLEKLRVRAAHWAKRHAQQIADAEPDYPVDFTDRQCDISEPLLAIASVLGDPWPARITTALTTIFNSRAAEDSSKGVLLLGHIRKVFLDKNARRLHTKDLIPALGAIPEAPWAEWNGGKPLNDRGLAKLLKEFEVFPSSVRDPDTGTGRGYKLEDLFDACERYLKPVCMCSGCNCHEACGGTCNASGNADSTNDDAGCNGVTDKTEGGAKRKEETGPQTVD